MIVFLNKVLISMSFVGGLIAFCELFFYLIRSIILSNLD